MLHSYKNLISLDIPLQCYMHAECTCVQMVMVTSKSDVQAKMGWTDYRVLSVPEESPRRCCLMQLGAVTGIHSYTHGVQSD